MFWNYSNVIKSDFPFSNHRVLPRMAVAAFTRYADLSIVIQ